MSKKQLMNALLMKIELYYEQGQNVLDRTGSNEYNIVRQIVSIIERNNEREKNKKRLKLVK